MNFKRIVSVIGMVAIVTAIVAVLPVEAEGPKKPKKNGATAQISSGIPTEAPEGTEWLIYDDGSSEAWSNTAYSGSYDAAGNKFTSTWGTFFCDAVSAYFRWTASTSVYLSAWNGLSGTTLQNNSYISFTPTTSTGTDWVLITSGGWVNNPAYTFSNTAWIGNDFYPSAEVGIDTDGGGSHGFLVTAYSGSGYTEQPFNAMIRARFNGDNVPVELMSFSAE